MNYAFTSEHPILLATSDRWIHMLSTFFLDAGLRVLAAPSYAEASAAMAAVPLSGIVVGFEWAVDDDSGRKGIVALVDKRIPTITLVQRGDGYYEKFDQIYHRPFHEYVVVPFDIEGLYYRMEKTGMIKRVD